MSFTNAKAIALDQLPDQRIFNPLRGKGARGGGGARQGRQGAAAPPPPPPQYEQHRAAAPPSDRHGGRQGGGLFSRIAPAAPQHHRPPPPPLDEAAGDSESDTESSEDSDQPPPRERGGRGGAPPPSMRSRGGEGPIASGPFAKVANTNQCSFQFVAAFKDVSGSLSKASASVTIQFSEVLRHADTPDSFSKLDPRRTIPIYVRITGTSLSDEHRRVCAIEVYDAAGKALYSKFVHKHSSNDAAVATGYPLFLFEQGAQNNIFFHPPELSSDHKTYWTFTMETLERNTSMFVNPSTGEQYVIIKKDSGCAKLMQYALSERNDIVRNPWLLENPAYQNPNDPDNIRLPIDMFNKVKAAYRKKLGEIAATSFDLSSIRVVLKPLELAKEMWAEHVRSPLPGSPVTNVNNVWGHIGIEVLAHIPSVEEEGAGRNGGGGPGAGPGQAGRAEESDEDL